MPVVISGTNGVSGVDGTASNPSYEGTDSNTGIFFPAADTVAIGTNGTEALRVNSSQNVGIGTSSISSTLTVKAQSGMGAPLRLESTDAGANPQTVFAGSRTYQIGTGNASSGFAGQLFFYDGTAAATRMLIDSSGNVGIGTTSPTDTAGFGRCLDIRSSSGAAIYLRDSDDTTNDTFTIGRDNADSYLNSASGNTLFFNAGSERARITSGGLFCVGRNDALDNYGVTFEKANDKNLILNSTTSGSGVYTTISFANQSVIKVQMFWLSTDSRFYIQNNTGGVYLAQNATAWTANSDERLKTDLVPIENAAQKVSTLRAVTGRYITDEEGVSRAFLIAQDVQAVLPEAVDATDTEKLGVAYTDTIPLLVAAIKEQQQMIETLQAKVAALEAK
jgi:hypothetical protein